MTRRLAAALALSSILLLTGCGGTVRVKPRPEPPRPKALDSAMPQDMIEQLREEGRASWYGPGFHGKRTANGEIYDMDKFTAAHRTLPFDTWVKVTNRENGRSVVVRVTDRGPFVDGRILDLSRAAMAALEGIGPGVIPVLLEPFILGGPHRFVVQAGAFSVRENAERLRGTLAAEFGAAFTVQFENFWRVRLGPYNTEAEAQRALARLRAMGQEGFMAVDDK